MTSLQRTIKYIAIGFAIFLTIGIITGIVNGAVAIFSMVAGNNRFERKHSIKVEIGADGDKSIETVDFSETFTDVKSLDLSNATGNLTIKEGNEFRVEAKNVTTNFEAEVSGNGRLTVKEDRRGTDFLWFGVKGITHPNSTIIVYLPADFIARETKIESGAGSVTIEKLGTDKLRISAGAGNIRGDYITANDVNIDGGVGNIDFTNVNFTDIDLDCGVGNLNLNGVLYGDNKINCGVGEVDIDINGIATDYNLDIDSGVGSIRVNGVKTSNYNNRNRNADHSIKIDGGLGNVSINFKENSF